MIQSLSYILNAVLTSGIIVTLVTLRSTKAKASADAKAAEIDNAEKLLGNFDSFIVKPLKTEVHELRATIQTLQQAIRQIPACPNADTCPVSRKLTELQHITSEPEPNPTPNPI